MQTVNERPPATKALPHIAGPHSNKIIVGEWTVDTPERQHATVNTFVEIWRETAWPEGLLLASLLLSTDGKSVVNYAQWKSDEAYDAFVQTTRQSIAERVNRAVPNIRRQPPVDYRLYRSGVRDGAPVPGCVVLVSVEFDGPDQARQRRWIDAVFEAIEGDPDLPPGGISAHFHVSIDGTRVLNYAEWTDEKAHQDAIDRSGNGTIRSGGKWRDIQTFPGLRSSVVRRYSPGLTVLSPQAGGQDAAGA